MMIDKIREEVIRNKGIMKSFVFKGTRNQSLEFDGVITDIYPAIFTITLSDNKVKSFSYSDVLIENLRIID
ncbi:MAG: hypothetical protein E7160_02925 [Firmicutes bacterium]|nr:hypothetical protein [Bacillota bacterium]